MKHWDVIGQINDTNEKIAADTVVNLLLRNRGITTKEAHDAFLNPHLSDVTPSAVKLDAKQLAKAITRIEQAITKKEKIIVYGDYDVDGITSSAIIWETVHELGADSMPYIPHRVDEGYGLSIKGLTNMLEKYPDAKLVITVDNGIVAHDAVTFANEQGLDVIITDHHVSADEEKLPKAHAIVHTTLLCGAGVAWVLSRELRRQMSDERRNDDHLELATLGTVADLVPLTGANRTIVMYGLRALQQTKRKGLLALYDESEIEPATLGVYQIGHVIGPRLNATGRMESAMDSLRLLCTKDTRRAGELAHLLGKTNRERQQVMFRATEHASLAVKNREAIKKVLVVSHEEYPEGVIGLVAGRLVEEYYRPSIVISRGEKTSKGSVRSVNGFNIIEFLRSASEYFLNVGGHPMAAGFTVETARLEELQKVLEEMAEGLLDEGTLTRRLRIDTVLPFSAITQEFYLGLQKLAPFGMGNPEPTFMSENVEIKDIRVIGKEGQHLKLLLSQEYGPILDAIAFGLGDMAQQVSKGDLISLVYTIDENTWQGKTKLQLKIKDLKKA